LVFEKNARLGIALETSHPRFYCPNSINSATLKESELIRVCGWDYRHVAAGQGDVESVRLQPCPAGNVLRVAEVRGGNFFSAKIRRHLDRRISLHHKRRASIGCAGNDADFLAVRFQVRVERGTWSDIG